MLTMRRLLKMGGNAWQYLVGAVAGEVGQGADEVGQGADAAQHCAGKRTPPGAVLGPWPRWPRPGSVKVGDVVLPEMVHGMLAQVDGVAPELVAEFSGGPRLSSK